MSAPTIFVHGPGGSGKSRHKSRLQAHFGCLGIVDEWDEHGARRITPGHLHLSISPPPKPLRGACQVFTIAEALKLISEPA